MGDHLRLIFQEEVKQIVHHFSTLLEIRTTFFTPDGSQVVVGGEKPNCMYCSYLHDYLDTEQQCKAFDAQKTSEATRRQELITYDCPGGLTGAAAPVIFNGRLLCVILIGQFRQTDGMPKDIAKRWNEKFHNDKLEKVFLQAPYFEPKKISDIIGLLSLFVKYISSQRLVHISHDPVVHLLEYIEDHPTDMLTLQDAAAMVHRSTSSVAHSFRKATGKSFRQFQIDKKLDLADEHFRTDPMSSVSQVAARVGYQDPLYFSRVYRKHRGFPPKATIQQFRANDPLGRRR